MSHNFLQILGKKKIIKQSALVNKNFVVFCQWFLKQTLSVQSTQLFSLLPPPKGICALHSCCCFFRHALFSLSLLFPSAQIAFISFFPHCLYSFPPPIDIRTLAFKNQSCCCFSSLVFTILLVRLGLWMLCPPFFIPFIAVSLLLPSLSFSRILPCSLFRILLLPWIPLPLKCHIFLWLLTGTSAFILLPVLKMRQDMSQGCIATSLRSKSCMQFRFFFPFSLNTSYPRIFRRGQVLPLWMRDLPSLQGLVLWGSTT